MTTIRITVNFSIFEAKIVGPTCDTYFSIRDANFHVRHFQNYIRLQVYEPFRISNTYISNIYEIEFNFINPRIRFEYDPQSTFYLHRTAHSSKIYEQILPSMRKLMEIARDCGFNAYIMAQFEERYAGFRAVRRIMLSKVLRNSDVIGLIVDMI